MARASTQVPLVRREELASRKLRDIAELINKPYPGIKLHIKDDNLEQACLTLKPEGERYLHLRVLFPEDYPLIPPIVTIQSHVVHPNVFNNYICATILNDSEAYTSAYTLKNICIQLLSFFSDDRIEAADGGGIIDVKRFRKDMKGDEYMQYMSSSVYTCGDCGFGIKGAPSVINVVKRAPTNKASRPPTGFPIAQVPFEILLMICDDLDSDELVVASKAWSRFGDALHHLIPLRNLQCFTLKKGTKDINLGVGVQVRKGSLSCEFDFVSDVAFTKLGVRKSIHGLDFSHWLPLALTERHWQRVKDNVLRDSLSGMQQSMKKTGPLVNVLYAFMNDVVVKLSDKANDMGVTYKSMTDKKSTLTHASEKAVESYFALFHLLICMATENPAIVVAARKQVDDFIADRHDKIAVPNLGAFLIARLLSDADRGSTQTALQQESVTIAIIKEAIVRNVVWMLSSHNNNGGGKPELAYMEPSLVSDYRLVSTYRASKTSYRLLMFQDLMRRTVLATFGSMSLLQIRSELFKRQGAPPDGAASCLAEQIRGIQTVNNFPGFFVAMEVKQPPSKERFTDFLRRSVKMSMDARYSRQALSQGEALYLRKQAEQDVQVVDGLVPRYHHGRVSFFLR
jgi:ubiquitin-protein ligase